jgi:hypothetical protein
VLAAAGCAPPAPSTLRNLPSPAAALPGKLSPRAVERLRGVLTTQQGELRVLKAGLGERRRAVAWARAEHQRTLALLRTAEAAFTVADRVYQDAERSATAAGKQANAFLEADRSASLSLELLQRLMQGRAGPEGNDKELLEQLQKAREAISATESARRSAMGHARESLDRFAQAKREMEEAKREVDKARLAVLTADSDLRRAEAEFRLDQLRSETLEKSTRDLTRQIEQGEVEQTYSDVYKRCTRVIDRQSKASDRSQATETKIKTLFGALTGGVATIGSSVASGLSSAQSSETRWYNRASLWVGIGTAVLTTVGTIVTLTISPRYQQRINRHATKSREIRERLASLGWLVGYSPASWSKRDRQKWSATLAELKGLCE